MLEETASWDVRGIGGGEWEDGGQEKTKRGGRGPESAVVESCAADPPENSPQYTHTTHAHIPLIPYTVPYLNIQI